MVEFFTFQSHIQPTENFQHSLRHGKQTDSKLFFTSSLCDSSNMCFNPKPVEPYYLGENVMEEDKRYAKMAPSNKILAIISCD